MPLAISAPRTSAARAMDAKKYKQPEQSPDVYSPGKNATQVMCKLKELPPGFRRRDVVWVPILLDIGAKEVDSGEQRRLLGAL